MFGIFGQPLFEGLADVAAALGACTRSTMNSFVGVLDQPLLKLGHSQRPHRHHIKYSVRFLVPMVRGFHLQCSLQYIDSQEWTTVRRIGGLRDR